MKYWKKRIATLGLALALGVILTSCGGGASAQKAGLYIRGLMDSTYLGVYDPEYLKLVNATEREAEQDHLDGLKAEYEMNVAPVFEIRDECISDGTRQDILDMLEEVYTYSRYQVKQAVKAGDSAYNVEVAVQPLTFFFNVLEEDFTQEVVDEFNSGFPELADEAALDGMTEEEYREFWQRYEESWAQMFLSLCRQRLDSGKLNYGDETSIVVQFKPDASDGLYTIPDTDFKNLDGLILQY